MQLDEGGRQNVSAQRLTTTMEFGRAGSCGERTRATSLSQVF
jgi:hypothetical protein